MRKTFLSFSSTSLESTLDVLWWSNFQDLSRSDWCFPGCQDLFGLRACEITVSRLIATLGEFRSIVGPFLGRRGEVIVGHKAADEISFFGPGCVGFFVSVGVVVESPETKNTHIISPTTAGIPPVVIPGISTRSWFTKMPLSPIQEFPCQVGSVRDIDLGIHWGPQTPQFSQEHHEAGQFFMLDHQEIIQYNKTTKHIYIYIQQTRVFFPSWQDASPVWIHIDFLWDIALPPYHVPGPPRLGNVWFRLGETGHDQHLGVWYLVDFFCLESFDCWGLHSGQTGKFETLFVLAGGQVSFSYNKCVWGFWNRFFSWAAKLRHVRRSWLCWRSYLSHHLRQWCDGFSLGRIWMGGDVRCGL